MKKILALAFALIAIGSCKPDDEIITEPQASINVYEGYTLLWNDEFNNSEISNLNWTYELGDGTDYGLPKGWGNEELQNYTNLAQNSAIETDTDGTSALVITALEDGNGGYTSAKLTTEGLHTFRYGRIEARIKLPTDQGMWPAFWMLGENRPQVDWPGCGEIDIMELVGRSPSEVHANGHYVNADKRAANMQGSTSITNATFDENYHDFRVDWTPEELTFSLDGEIYLTLPIGDDMKEFQRSFYLILNVAVGGSWPGSPDATTEFPQKMYVDYVRVYSQNGLNASAEPALNLDEETVGSLVTLSAAQHAFAGGLDQFSGIELKTFGAGGEPLISSSANAIDGDSSLLFSYPGGNWGGGWFQKETPQDMSVFASKNLVFAINQNGALANAEIKLEATETSAIVKLADYTPISLADGFVQYTIPLADFSGLDFSDIIIPFALWNPVDDSGAFPAVDVLVDNIRWE